MQVHLLRLFLIFLMTGAATKAVSQVSIQPDTMRITLSEAESRFMQKNLLLLAQKFNIEENKAYILQAKLWDNPSIYLEQSTYNRTTREYFPAKGPNGQNIVQIQQLFLLAGKRNKRVNLERINSEIAEYQFYDMIRTLKYELRNSFFGIYFLQHSLLIYDTEIQSLQRTVDLYQGQYDRGNVPLKELIRLKAFLFTLENERKTLRSQIAGHQADMLVLLGDTTLAYLLPDVEKSSIDKLTMQNYSLSQLAEMAQANRFDLKAYQAGNRYAKQNMAYQKSLAVPDVRIGGVYDRNGSYISNYTGLSLQIDLPLFNRNQGNIKASQARLQNSELLENNYQLQVEKEVMQAYVKSQEADNLFRNFDKQFASDFDRLMEGITRSYERKNITLIEFIDFFESYKNNVLQMNQLQTDRIQAFEELSLTTGKDLFVY